MAPSASLNVRGRNKTESQGNQALTQSAVIGQFEELITQPLAFTHCGLPVLIASGVIPHKALEVAAIWQFAVGQASQVLP